MASLSERLAVATRAKLALFEGLRKGTSSIPFWDLVLLTASDEAQAASYTAQLQAKQERKEIPASRYHVIADPPGPKIGNGGATLEALRWLEQRFEPQQLDGWRILLIHAGGFSKRLPNVSVIGKIFAAVPLGEPVFQMLEVKLATYIEFPAHMAPGVFVACADDIELFESNDQLSFHHPGFTALAHPSSLEIGTTHGVFVLHDPAALASDLSAPCHAAICSRFLHKPSITAMRVEGAVIPGTEIVYTDSAYYFDRPTGLKLLEFYKTHAPLTCEIDAYGDFLQALGPNASDEYTRNTANVVKVEESLVATRAALFQHLRGTPLNVIACNVSKFYHIGTVSECLFHYCLDPCLAAEMGLQPRAGSRLAADPGTKCCLINSRLAEGAAVGDSSVVEYSTLGAGARIGRNCLVSNVQLPAGSSVPDNVFLHTAAVSGGYVTVAFGKDDDVKKAASAEAAAERLKLLGASVGAVLVRLGLSLQTAWPSAASCSLWDAALFPVLPTPEASATWALELVNGSGPLTTAGARLVGMAGVVEGKDIDRTLALQRLAVE